MARKGMLSTIFMNYWILFDRGWEKNELENLTEDQRKGISKLIAQLKE
jgi:hypothetical protein